MRITILALLILLLSTAPHPLAAQSADQLGRISLTVVTPESHAGLSASDLAALRSKIVQAASAHGLSGDGNGSGIVIYPVVTLHDERTVEGLQNLTVVRGELGLHVKNVGEDLVFASYASPISGHGTSRRQAVARAIRDLDPGDREAARFFATARERIGRYYETECDHLLDRARALTRSQLFDHAFGLVASIPTASPSCYGRAQAAMESVFDAYQQQHCSEQVQAARAALASNAYRRALTILANVDPASSCHGTARQLVDRALRQVDARDRRYYEAAQEAYRTAARITMRRIEAASDVRRERIRAARDIARAYYAYRASRVPYHTLVSTTVIR